MKKTKKILAVACAMALSAAIAVGGTLAYLTSTTQVVTNTFTVGNVAITLDEAPVDVYGVVVEGARRAENSYKLIPGHNYTKDPIVHVDSDSEACWLFVKVVNEIAGIEADTKIAAQMTANGWTALDGVDNVYWHAVVDPAVEGADLEIEVFQNFTVSGAADVSTYAGKTITVQAYAIQADNFNSAPAAWTAAPASWT